MVCETIPCKKVKITTLQLDCQMGCVTLTWHKCQRGARSPIAITRFWLDNLIEQQQIRIHAVLRPTFNDSL